MFKKEIAGIIYSTNDYDVFKIIEVNREIERSNVEKLKNSMQKKNLMCPVIVNEKMEIIDGQHRYMSWKELGEPIFYYIIEGASYEEMITLNVNKSSWILSDYLEHFVKVNKDAYFKFKNILTDYGVNISDLLLSLDALSGESIGESAITKKFKEGELDMSKSSSVVEFLNDLRLFSDSEIYLSTSFVRAFLKLYLSKFYDSEFMKKRSSLSAVKIQQNKKGSGNIDEQCEFLAKIYMSKRDDILVMYDRGSKAFYNIASRKI